MGIIAINGSVWEETEGSAFAASKLTTKEMASELPEIFHSTVLSVPVPSPDGLPPGRFN